MATEQQRIAWFKFCFDKAFMANATTWNLVKTFYNNQSAAIKNMIKTEYQNMMDAKDLISTDALEEKNILETDKNDLGT